VTQALLKVSLVEDAQEALPPPPQEKIEYFARDLSDTETKALFRASRVLVLEFVHPSAVALEALARADRIAHAVARQLDGVLYDVELRRAVGTARWRSGRLDEAAASTPSVLEHTAIHAYRDGEWVRSVTVGMKKLGLPELAVDESSSGNSTRLAWIINAIGQRLVEGQRPDAQGWFDLDLREVRHPEVRERVLEDLMPNGSARGRFRLIESPPEEGDADNTLWAVGFQAFDGPDLFARQDAAVSALFGWRDEVKTISHDDELLAASERAREKLPAVRAIVQRGLKPGEMVQVKLPFATPDGGNEWMWVEVARWEGDTIHGVLTNEPFQIPDLHAGQRVRGNAGDVFDYLLQHADGRVEGNETGEVIQRMQGETERRGSE
jgi:uncharacterized protein YegJ (DUF2314 family)